MHDSALLAGSTASLASGPEASGAGTESPLRVLLVAHVDRLSARLDKSQFYRYAALARHPGVVLFGPGTWGYRPGMSVAEAVEMTCGGVMPDVILHGIDFKESGVPLLAGLPDASALTVLELQDSWTFPEDQAAFINREKFDIGLLIVRHHIPFYRERCPDAVFLWTPHAINTRLFRDYRLPKEHDVLLYGNLASHTYPFRSRLATLLPQTDLRCRILAHPGYYPHREPPAVPLITGTDLSREINASWIAISTSSIHQCVMMKYFEIAASGTLIAGDMPEEGRVIFGDDFLELRPEQSDDEIVVTFRNCLADKERLQVRARAAHEQVMREHSTEAFASRLLAQLRQIVVDRRCRETVESVGVARPAEADAALPISVPVGGAHAHR